jgi:hypothetical protein
MVLISVTHSGLFGYPITDSATVACCGAAGIPHLHAVLRDINTIVLLAALVLDFFGSMMLPLAAKLGVPAYLFFPGNLTELALMRSAVELNDGDAIESTATSRTLSSFPLR